MASAPSASALSAVLRCRGNLWKRNPQSKRPATGVYGSLGMGRSLVAARADLLLLLRGGEQGSLGRRRVTLAFKSHQDRVENTRDKNPCELDKLRYSRVAQSSGSAHLQAGNDALVCQLARGIFSFLPSWTDTVCGVVRTVASRTRRSPSCWETAVAPELSGLAAGALKVSLIISPCSVGNSGHAPWLAASSWTTLKRACLSLTALVSGVMCSSLALLLCSSSSRPAQLDRKQSEESDQQVEGQTHPSRDLTSTEDICSSRNRTTRGQT